MHLILLHGATGSAKQFNLLLPQLAPDFRLHTINFAGHGGTPSLEPFSIAGFAQQVITYIDEKIVPTGAAPDIHVFGYSMGGYVALYLARYYGNRIKKVITLATKFRWDAETAEKEAKMLDPEKIMLKVPAFAEELAVEHAPENWKQVLHSTALMLLHMAIDNPLKQEDYGVIVNECLLLLGDRDKMVSLNETHEVYEKLPKAQFGVLPATPHRFEQVEVPLLTFVIRRFLLQ